MARAVRVAPRPPSPTNRAASPAIVDGLDALYPDAHCELDFASPFQLLVATILSAQCTDMRVNLVTPKLFAKYGTPPSWPPPRRAEIETIIQSTGFYRNKAKNILGAARVHHGGLRRRGAADDGRAADAARRRAQDGQRGARLAPSA